MVISTAKDLGELIRQVRRQQGLTQTYLAATTGTGERFIIDLERGKETCQLNLALHVAAMLGIKIEATPPK